MYFTINVTGLIECYLSAQADERQWKMYAQDNRSGPQRSGNWIEKHKAKMPLEIQNGIAQQPKQTTTKKWKRSTKRAWWLVIHIMIIAIKKNDEFAVHVQSAKNVRTT